MGEDDRLTTEHHPHVPGVGWGIVCGLGAAIFYTITNVALRGAVEIDPFLVSAVKALPTVLLLAPLILLAQRPDAPTRSRSLLQKTRVRQLKWQFVGVALVGQVIGNGAFQIALGQIGLAASVPITLGCLLIGGAVLGNLLLGEPVRPRVIIAITILLVAVVVLSWTRASEAEPSDTMGTGVGLVPKLAWLGGLGAAASGFAYAFFSTMMRRSMQRGMTSVEGMWISGVVGSLALWAITAGRVGWQPVADLTSPQWWMMGAAGFFNFTAFVSISTALRALPVVAVHLLNATQVAMAAVAGVLVFSEQITPGLAIGIALTIAGLLVLVSGKRARTPSEGRHNRNRLNNRPTKGR